MAVEPSVEEEEFLIIQFKKNFKDGDRSVSWRFETRERDVDVDVADGLTRQWSGAKW